MKLFAVSKDGGPESTVTGYWLIEWKRLFSIALLRFDDGTRDAYHSHAFNCISWVLSGRLDETLISGIVNIYRPSLWPVITRKDTFHKVCSKGRTWVLTFRGPWTDEWEEYLPRHDARVRLTHGRKVIGTY